LAFKLNLRNNVNVDIWEFGATMRPWAQIYLSFFIVKFIQIFGINNPFVWVYSIQLFFSLIGFISIYLFYKLLIKKNIISFSKFNIFIYFLFVFTIFLHSRTSSENLSISFFLLGINFFLNQKKFTDIKYRNLIVASIFFGISIVIRYQIIFLIAPFYLWVFLYQKSILKIFFSFFIVITILFFGLIIDFYGYGFLNNTYYNYFYYNIIVGIFDNFGIEPWWYYFEKVVTNFYPPLGILVLISFLFYIIIYPKLFISWTSFFYFVIFSYLGHKELRFLFPILIFSPIFLINLNSFLTKLNYVKSSYSLKFFIIFFNLIFIFTLFFPAERQTHLYRFVYDNLGSENILYTDQDPYLIDGLKPNFYVHSLPMISEINDENNNNFKNVSIIINDYNIYKSITKQNINCKKIYSSYPEKIIEINQNWKKRNLNWFIVKCN
jgi:phosphatidylinositol glycan class B